MPPDLQGRVFATRGLITTISVPVSQVIAGPMADDVMESLMRNATGLPEALFGSGGSGNSGGKFGPFIKFSGYDIIAIEGISPSPVYLEIIDGNPQLKDASELWGRTSFDTTKSLTDKVERCSVACIGPAGENLVKFAAIMNEEHRATGRTGVGAVMGSKKLKAIVLAGSERPSPADEERFKVEAKKANDKIKENGLTGEGLGKLGTPILVKIINGAGALPYKNWQSGVNPDVDNISGEALEEKYLVKNHGCWGCRIHCGRITKVPDGPYQVLISEGPEYESIWSLGSATAVSDLDAIIKANHYCDEFGMDTITLGSTIACAMELREKGAIPDELLQGIDLQWGNAAAMLELVWKTAYNAGFGKYIALGSKRLAEMFGHPELSMSAKGLEMPAYDPRGIKGIGLNYATSNRGGCHVTGYTIAPEIAGLPEKIDPLAYEGKAGWVKAFQDFTCLVNSTGNCLFTTFALGADDYAALLSSLTGWDLSSDDVLEIGERVYNLERLIMSMYGFDDSDDTLPKRLLEEPLPDGPAKGEVVDLDRMKSEYYELRGWKDGVPSTEKLEELGIDI